MSQEPTVEEAMERLYFLAKVEPGLVQSDGETVSKSKSDFLPALNDALVVHSQNLGA
jgi:hypothetical protein